MSVSETRHIKKSRKNYPCDWCWENIDTGQPYSSWFCYGESVTARMHPECYAAMLKADLHDEELPTPGTFGRGCWCGEDAEFCKCGQPRLEKPNT